MYQSAVMRFGNRIVYGNCPDVQTKKKGGRFVRCCLYQHSGRYGYFCCGISVVVAVAAAGYGSFVRCAVDVPLEGLAFV